jgi:hypothetical protein
VRKTLRIFGLEIGCGCDGSARALNRYVLVRVGASERIHIRIQRAELVKAARSMRPAHFVDFICLKLGYWRGVSGIATRVFCRQPSPVKSYGRAIVQMILAATTTAISIKAR